MPRSMRYRRDVESRPSASPTLAAASVNTKFALAMVLSLAWFAFTIWIAMPWMRDLARLAKWPIAILVIGGIALVPGFMNACLAVSLLIDRRPPRCSFDRYPAITILIAAY